MLTRRDLIQSSIALGVGTTLSQNAIAQALKIKNSTGEFMKTKGLIDKSLELPLNKNLSGKHYVPKFRMGLGGLAAGNGFNTISTDEEILKMLHSAWDSGIRHFDTSPFYGLSLSERRFGDLLRNKRREEYILSSKVGRLLTPSSKPLPKKWHWAKPSPFHYRYDYTASGTRRSVEDTLHRLGVSSLDIVYIHDLSPQNSDLGSDWLKYFEEARKGAMPELTKMREEGIIKGWGLGINTPHAVSKTLEVADPDIFLLALQYSILDHDEAISSTFPLLKKNNVSAVLGAPLNGGYLAGRNRYNYSQFIPEDKKVKLKKITEIANKHGIDIKTAALQFAAAPDEVSSIIPGARTSQQILENVNSMKVKIPKEFWSDLKNNNLIAKTAQTPK